MERIVYSKGIPFKVLMDDVDFERFKNYTLSIDKAGYPRLYIKKGEHQYMHRMIFNLTDRKIEVDHINRNKADNRRCNLRICSHKQNTKNITKRENTTSQYNGVYYNKLAKRYAATLQVDGKKISLKTYETEIEAAIAYDIASIKYNRNFGTLNFPGLIDIFNNFILSPENQISADQYLTPQP